MKLKLNGKNGKKNGNGNGNGYRNGNGRGATLLKAALLVLAVVLVGALVFRQLDRLRGPKVEAWVAATALQPGTVVGANDIERAWMRASELPIGAVADAAAIAGQQIVRPKAEGEPFVADDVRPVAAPAQQRALSLAELLPAGRVLVPVEVQIESVVVPELNFGDRIELIAAPRGAGRAAGARVVASDAFFLAWVDLSLLNGGGSNGGRAGSSSAASGGGGLLSSILSMPAASGGNRSAISGSTKLLLALYPEDVLPVTEAETSGSRLSLVLHGRREVEEGRLIALPTPAAREVELIAGQTRETVDFAQ